MKKYKYKKIDTGTKKIILYAFLFGVSLALMLMMLLLVLVKQSDKFIDRISPVTTETSPETNTPFSISVSATSLPTHTVTTATVTPTSTSTLMPTPSLSPTPLPPEGEAFSIGNSVEEKALEVYRFGNGEKVRMIIGGIHGGYEWNTSVLAYKLRDDIRNGVIIIPANITLYILPILNPDGYFDYPKSSHGRANARGVDLNRNWDAVWEPDWDRTGCFSYVYLTAGEKPFSEPETQALSQFLLDNHVDALISYHSAMSSIFAGGRPDPDPASDDLARTLARASGYSYPPNDGGYCYYTGQLIDWASAMGIAAVDVELTDHQSNDILINRDLLKAFLAWDYIQYLRHLRR